MSRRFHPLAFLVGVWIWLSQCALFAQDQQMLLERPVALVLEASGGELRRFHTQNPLHANPGDVLFENDSILLERGSMKVALCDEHAVYALEGDPKTKAEVTIVGRQLSGPAATAVKPELLRGVCLLPQMKRSNAAGEQRYGDSLTNPPQEPNESLQYDSNQFSDVENSQLQQVDAVIANPQSPNPLVALVSRFAILQGHANQEEPQVATLRELMKRWPGATWAEPLFFYLRDHACYNTPATLPQGDGKTYALVIGISHFDDKLASALQYTGLDALAFKEYLESKHGGLASLKNDVMHYDPDADNATIRNHIEDIVAHAKPNDTVTIFIGSHGAMDGLGRGYIYTKNTTRENLEASALSMIEVQKLMERRLCRAGKARVFIDVCHAGLAAPNVATALQSQLIAGTRLTAFLASQPSEYSFENKKFGGGHGAFTYFVLRGLSGEADGFGPGSNKDGIITVRELSEYVQARVKEATQGQQTPETKPETNNDTLAELAETEPKFTAPWEPLSEEDLQSARRGSGDANSAPPLPLPPPRLPANEWEAQFDEAIRLGRILPGKAESAFDMLQRLDRRDPKYPDYQNQLRVALEEAGQKVIGTYLKGDDIPQERIDFSNCGDYYKAARDLTPESVFLHSRQLFCEGRATLFDKEKSKDALVELELAARLDTTGAYIPNAIGIAYLEQGEFARAEPAFRDAIAFAPEWAYPRHNLALAYAEQGKFAAAIQSYEQAIVRGPNYFYLLYNLGLVYERVNNLQSAEDYFRKAMDLAPNRPESYNALGSVKVKQHHDGQAENLYRQALDRKRDFAPALHNWAALAAGKRGRLQEALDRWRTNVALNSYLPSQVALADTLFRLKKRRDEAIVAFEKLLELSPHYVGARMKLAQLLSDPRQAADQLKAALADSPDNPLIEEKLGDLEKRYDASSALERYRAAVKHAKDPLVQKRASKQVRRLEKEIGRGH